MKVWDIDKLHTWSSPNDNQNHTWWK